MADNLSPLVNLDLINQIYRTINAQITERVYDPLYYPEATLGSKANKYKSAWISGNTSTGTLNDLTLTKATAGFTISGGETTSKMLTVADTATINKSLEVTVATSITGTLTVSAATNIKKGLTVGTTGTGAVTVQSSGAENTTIEGPSGGTATFTAPTSDVPGSLQIKNNSYTSTVSVAHGKTISTRSNLTVGESGNTGDVVIRPKNTYKLTITSNDTNATTAILRNGTCVITDDYAENNTAGKLVKRDSNSNINVTSVNKVAIDAATANANKIGLSKGTASIAVTEAGLNVSKNLKVLAATTLGEKGAEDITIKSAGTGSTAIIGPNSGIAAFTTPTEESSGSLEIKNSDGTIKSAIKIASGKTIDTYSNLTIGDKNNNGSVIIKPSGVNNLTITSSESADTAVTLRSGTCVVTTDCSENNTASTLVKRDGNSNINVTSVNSVGITGGKENSTDKITLSKGNANINVTGASLSVSKNLKVLSVATLGEASTGNVTVKSAGAKDTIIVGPNGGKAAELIGGVYTTSATTENSTTPTSDKLLKIGTVDAKKFLAGPASSSGIASYRTIVDSDLPEASASASGIVTTGTQTFAGEKTFSETISGSINGNAATLSLAKGDEDFSSFIVFQDAQNNTSKLTAHYATDFKYNPFSSLMDVGSVRLNSKVTFQYNSSTESLDFIFA